MSDDVNRSEVYSKSIHKYLNNGSLGGDVELSIRFVKIQTNFEF